MHDRDHVTQVNEAYHDAIAGHYDDRFEGHSDDVLEWVRGLFEREVFPALDAFGGTPRVIDFGCGSGYLEDFLTGRELDLLGIDVSEGMLARAREQFPMWRFEKRDLYSFPSDERFHLVMENAVLHHLVDYEALVDKMAAMTLPGGILYLGNEPNRRAYKYLKPLVKAYRSTINRYRTETAVSELGTRTLKRSPNTTSSTVKESTRRRSRTVSLRKASAESRSTTRCESCSARLKRRRPVCSSTRGRQIGFATTSRLAATSR